MWLILGCVAVGCPGGGGGGSASSSEGGESEGPTATSVSSGPVASSTGAGTSGATEPDPTTGTTAATTDATGTTGTGGEPPELLGHFRRGINFGFRNPNFTDPDMAYLAAEAGCDSARLKLSEGHLDQWGYDIEAADMAAYAQLGMSRHVAFLIEPIAAHSTAPPDVQPWELAYYIPSNLYEPVTVDGAINPNNYWAAYVYKTVDAYKDWVDLWEVWNEPDWVPDWQVTQTWATDPPLKEQLPRFGGSIFDYVRMLRVTTEAARLADPDARVALGGLGYPTFLSAILRYTDNPDQGKVSPEYPETGAAYFDVLNIHYYPLWTPGSSDAGVDGFFALRDAFAAVMDAAGVAPRPFHATETGAPRGSVMGAPGGEAYARNYFLKAMVRAQAEGFLGVDWFSLSDDEGDPGAFGRMGLYFDVVALPNKEAGMRTPTGVAARTLGTLLAGAQADPAGTAALALPPALGGAAFRLPDDRRALVLWARAAGADESAAANYELVSDVDWLAHAWDHSATDMVVPRSPQGGVVALALSADPQVFLEAP